MGKMEVNINELASRVRAGQYAMQNAPRAGYANETLMAVARDQWLSMTCDEKAKLVQRHFMAGNFRCIERLSIFSSREELTQIISRLPHNVQMMYVNYINGLGDEDKHIITDKEIEDTLEACCNVALVFIVNAVAISTCMERMVRAWGDSKIVNKRVLEAIRTMIRFWQKNDDISCVLTQSSVMPVIWEKMNAMRDEYKNSSCFVDILQDNISEISNNGVEDYYRMCDGIKCEDSEVVKYAFLLHSIMASTCDEIQRRYDKAGHYGEQVMKEIGIKKVDLSAMKKFIDNAKLVASAVSNYSITKDMWLDMHKNITDHLADVYESVSDIVIEAWKEAEMKYLAFYFGAMVIMRRSKTKIADAIKKNCMYATKCSTGYLIVMKDIKKLDTLTQGDDNPYSIGDTLLSLYNNGEKFPAFNKIVDNKNK